jgi:recombination protein RecA
MTAPARVLASSELSASVRELKLQLGALEEGVRPDRAPLPTGIAELDALLVGRGIPRGRLTEITGASGSGRTSMLRTLVTAVATGGRWVAYIDATRTLAPRDWAHIGSERAPLWIIRPTDAARAAWCADLLLRSGAFALVVMDGAPQLSRVLAVRLTRLARDVGAAFVVTGEHGGDATGSSVRIRLAARDLARAAPGSGNRSERTSTITLEKGGKRRTIEVRYGRAVARRLCSHPEVPDRRGVAHPERPYTPAPSTPIITSYPDGSDAGQSARAQSARAQSARAQPAAQDSVAPTPPRRKRRTAFVG